MAENLDKRAHPCHYRVGDSLMARFINGDWAVTSLKGHRLSGALQTGSLLILDVNPNPDRPLPAHDTSLFLRVTDVGLEPRFPHQAWLFKGFVSDGFVILDGRLLDALNPERVQFVEGLVFPGTDEGTIRPGDPREAERAGMEEWLVEAGPDQSLTIGRISARSEREAARVCGFVRGSDPGTYIGMITPDGSLLTVRFKRVRDIPSWPPT